MTHKSRKTTIIGIVSFILFLIAVLLLVINKITLEEFTAIIASITSFALFLLGLYAKDKNATHSMLNKTKEE